jgi:hypothetical protein
MTISPINSIAGGSLSQNVLTSSNSNPLQQALQALQHHLASGNLTGTQTAFQTLQTLVKNSAATSASSVSSGAQLSNDMVVLGNALSTGDVTTAQTAFASVLSDLKNTSLPAQTNGATAAAQSVQLVHEVLSTVDSTNPPSSSSDLTNSVLASIYTSNGSLDVYA